MWLLQFRCCLKWQDFDGWSNELVEVDLEGLECQL